MLYIVFSRNTQCDDEYDNDRMVEYITEDKEKAIEFLNSERERYFTSKVGSIYLDEKYHFIFGNCYNWDYEYWIEKYPLDKDIRRWILEEKIGIEL